jgi:hypothetical protein
MNALKRLESVLKYHGYEKYLDRLKGYEHRDELQELQEGAYLRWIHLDRGTLTNGAILVRLQLVPDGIYLTLKTPLGRFFSVWADDVLLFEKITDETRLRRALQAFSKKHGSES